MGLAGPAAIQIGSGARRCPLRDPCECLGHFEKQPLSANLASTRPQERYCAVAASTMPQTAHRCAWRHAILFRVVTPYQQAI